jgi:hypothetical protein
MLPGYGAPLFVGRRTHAGSASRGKQHLLNAPGSGYWLNRRRNDITKQVRLPPPERARTTLLAAIIIYVMTAPERVLLYLLILASLIISHKSSLIVIVS